MTSTYEMNKLKARVEALEKQVQSLIADQHTHAPLPPLHWMPSPMTGASPTYVCPQCGGNPPAVCGNVACPGIAKVTC